jgi:hypothetical protein
MDYVPGDSICALADALEGRVELHSFEVPVEFSRVANVTVNHRRRNFRKQSDARKPKKSKAAST